MEKPFTKVFNSDRSLSIWLDSTGALSSTIPSWSFPLIPEPGLASNHPLSFSNWVRRNRLLAGVSAGLSVLVVAWFGIIVFRSVAPPSDLLPSTPSGWTRLATVSGSRSAETNVWLHGVQLQVCWSVKGGDIASLSYEIGSPVNGATPLYGKGG